METILRSIGNIARMIQTKTDVELKPFGLEKGQYVYITRIFENPGIHQEELSRQIKMDKTSTSKALKKLESLGYIIRAKDPEDKRKYNIRVTEEGKKIYLIIMDKERENLEILKASLSEQDLINLKKYINQTSLYLEEQLCKARAVFKAPQK